MENLEKEILIKQLRAELEKCRGEVEQLRKHPNAYVKVDELTSFYTMGRMTNEIDQLRETLLLVVKGLIDGGYNSVRETLALMAEGEGDDSEVYRRMANGALKKVDALLASIRAKVPGVK